MLLLNNLSMYINCISLESTAPIWNSIICQFDIMLRKLPSVLPNPCDMTPVLKIITAMLKVSGISTARYILEPLSKLLSFATENCSFKLQHMLDICSLGNRSNVKFVVLEAGGTIAGTNILGEQGMLYKTHAHMLISTCAAECMREHLNKCLEFICDIHTLTKVKSNMRTGSSSLNEDTLGSQLKSDIAQYVALEITRGNTRDTNRAITRYLPWLYHPSSSVQQGPNEFTDCIGHIRTLSWVLIGSLTHIAMTEGAAPVSCLPIPLDASSYIAEHVLVIMTGFDERSKKRNKDGLVYADLVFENNPSGRKFVIRGLENRTGYADVDFTKKADPLSSDDSDDEIKA